MKMPSRVFSAEQSDEDHEPLVVIEHDCDGKRRWLASPSWENIEGIQVVPRTLHCWDAQFVSGGAVNPIVAV